MKAVKDNNYVQIAGWMINRLNLSGNELYCYAIIYGFSQDGESFFMGSLKYLEQWMNVSQPTVLKALKGLMEKGLIKKHDIIKDKVKLCYYQTNESASKGTKESLEGGTKESLEGGTKESLEGGTKESLDNNNSVILNNPITNKDNIKEKILSNDNPKNKRFVKPTIEQIQAYIDEKNMHFDAERFFDYYESKGWMVGKNHMKDWKAACRTWESIRKSEKREEKEESAQVQEMSESEAIVWKNNQEWMDKKVPRLKDRITYDDFCKMRAMAHFKSDVYADILVHIEKSGYDGDIVDEFDRMCETEYYEKIWGNG